MQAFEVSLLAALSLGVWTIDGARISQVNVCCQTKFRLTTVEPSSPSIWVFHMAWISLDQRRARTRLSWICLSSLRDQHYSAPCDRALGVPAAHESHQWKLIFRPGNVVRITQTTPSRHLNVPWDKHLTGQNMSIFLKITEMMKDFCIDIIIRAEYGYDMGLVRIRKNQSVSKSMFKIR